MVVLLVVLTIIVFLTVEAVYHHLFKGKEAAVSESAGSEAGAQGYAFENLFEPEGLYYNPSHVWAFLEMNGKVALGLDHFFHQIVGKIDKIIVPDEGKSIQKETDAIIIQSGGRTVRARIPVSGKIEAINREILEKPELLLSDAYKNGWIVRMAPASFMENVREMKFGREAKAWLADEITKLKDYFSAHFSAREPAFQTMYDGGLPVQGIKSMLSDEQWIELKREFFSDESA